MLRMEAGNDDLAVWKGLDRLLSKVN